MKILLNGFEILIDDSSETFFLTWKWHIHKSGNNLYVRGYQAGNRKGGLHYLHRVLTLAKKGEDIDHINGNGLDNRGINLRQCTRSQNNANRKFVQSKTSGFKGVHLEKQTGKWRAEIWCNKIRYRLGRFENKSDAVYAYRKKALELYGEYAS